MIDETLARRAKEYRVALATRIPVSLMAALDKAAADSGRSKAEIVVEALTKQLKGGKKQ